MRKAFNAREISLIRRISPAIYVTLALILGSWPVSAQEVGQAGVVTFANGASIGIATASNGSTIFSGDLLKTGEAGRLQIQSGTMQFVLDARSAARIFKTGDRVLVELEQGSLVYSAKGVSENLTLFAQDIRFVPRTTELAVGQITIISRCDVQASTSRSSLEATSGKETRTIDANKSYSVIPLFGVDYNDSWKPTVQDYPEYPRNADYHRSHNHIACSPGDQKTQKLPKSTATEGHFILKATTIAVVPTAIILWKALESPDKP